MWLASRKWNGRKCHVSSYLRIICGVAHSITPTGRKLSPTEPFVHAIDVRTEDRISDVPGSIHK